MNFVILHQRITSFFQKIKNYEEQYRLPVIVAMEGYNGYARPIDKLVLSKGVLQEVAKVSTVNEKLKCLSRRRRTLVDDKVRIVNRLQSDLQSISPDFISISGSIENKWFLNFITAKQDITKLLNLRRTSLLKIKGIG